MKGGNCFFNPYKVVKMDCSRGIFKRLTIPEQVIMIVANTLDISVRGMRPEHRTCREATEARFIAMTIIWKFCQPITKVNLGKVFRKDHTNVIYALNTAQDWYDGDKVFREKMDKCIMAVNSVIPTYEAA